MRVAQHSQGDGRLGPQIGDIQHKLSALHSGKQIAGDGQKQRWRFDKNDIGAFYSKGAHDTTQDSEREIIDEFRKKVFTSRRKNPRSNDLNAVALLGHDEAAAVIVKNYALRVVRKGGKHGDLVPEISEPSGEIGQAI